MNGPAKISDTGGRRKLDLQRKYGMIKEITYNQNSDIFNNMENKTKRQMKLLFDLRQFFIQAIMMLITLLILSFIFLYFYIDSFISGSFKFIIGISTFLIIDVVILLIIRKLSIGYRTYKKETQIKEIIWSETLGVYLIKKIMEKYKKSK